MPNPRLHQVSPPEIRKSRLKGAETNIRSCAQISFTPNHLPITLTLRMSERLSIYHEASGRRWWGGITPGHIFISPDVPGRALRP